MTRDEAIDLLSLYQGMTWAEASHELADTWAPDAEGDWFAPFHDEADAMLDEARDALGLPSDVDRNSEVKLP